MNIVTFIQANGMLLMLWPLVPLSLVAFAVAVMKLLDLSKKDLGDFVKNMGYAVTYGGIAMMFTATYKLVQGFVVNAIVGVVAAVFIIALGIYVVLAGVALAADDD